MSWRRGSARVIPTHGVTPVSWPGLAPPPTAFAVATSKVIGGRPGPVLRRFTRGPVGHDTRESASTRDGMTLANPRSGEGANRIARRWSSATPDGHPQGESQGSGNGRAACGRQTLRRIAAGRDGGIVTAGPTVAGPVRERLDRQRLSARAVRHLTPLARAGALPAAGRLPATIETTRPTSRTAPVRPAQKPATSETQGATAETRSTRTGMPSATP